MQTSLTQGVNDSSRLLTMRMIPLAIDDVQRGYIGAAVEFCTPNFVDPADGDICNAGDDDSSSC